MARTISSNTIGPVVLRTVDNPLTITMSILGGEDGVIVQRGIGTVMNAGSITATVDDGVALFAGGGVTNVAGASILALDTVGAAIFITGGTGTVANYGRIAGGKDGVFFTSGGNVTNAASASISSQLAGVF